MTVQTVLVHTTIGGVSGGGGRERERVLTVHHNLHTVSLGVRLQVEIIAPYQARQLEHHLASRQLLDHEIPAVRVERDGRQAAALHHGDAVARKLGPVHQLPGSHLPHDGRDRARAVARDVFRRALPDPDAGVVGARAGNNSLSGEGRANVRSCRGKRVKKYRVTT